jgi:hypothetical protein
MKLDAFLCNHAEAQNNLLFINGGGRSIWAVSEQEPVVTMGIAIKVEIPWDRTNERLVFKAELLDMDGQPVSPDGDNFVKIEMPFEAGRPAGIKPGTPLDQSFAININGLPLPGGRYVWRYTINDRVDGLWENAFTVVDTRNNR